MEDTMIKNLEEKTGKKLSDWIGIVKKSGLTKHGEMVNLLKEKHGMTHGYANLVVHYAKGSDAGSMQNSGVDLLQEQFKGKENLLPIYEKILKAVQSFGNDVEVAPKKANVSLRRKKQFALIQPSTKTRMDVGLVLKNEKPQGKLEVSGSWSAMCTHRVKIESDADISKDLIGWLKKAYEQA